MDGLALGATSRSEICTSRKETLIAYQALQALYELAWAQKYEEDLLREGLSEESLKTSSPF